MPFARATIDFFFMRQLLSGFSPPFLKRNLLQLQLGPSVAFFRTLAKPQNEMDPDSALQRLRDGNIRYVTDRTFPRDYSKERSALTKAQNPFACILSCADSRVCPELAFDENRGDLFVTRLPGNYVSMDVLASLEYGTAVLKAPLIMVMGHTECGAMKAAIQAKKSNSDFPGHISNIATAVGPAVRAAIKNGHTDDDACLLDDATREHIKLTAGMLREAAPILSQLVSSGKLKVVGGLYHLDTGRVELIDVGSPIASSEEHLCPEAIAGI